MRRQEQGPFRGGLHRFPTGAFNGSASVQRHLQHEEIVERLWADLHPGPVGQDIERPDRHRRGDMGECKTVILRKHAQIMRLVAPAKQFAGRIKIVEPSALDARFVLHQWYDRTSLTWP